MRDDARQNDARQAPHIATSVSAETKLPLHCNIWDGGGGEAAKKQYAGMLNSFPKCAKTGEPQLTKTLLYQPVVSLEADSSLWPDE